MFDGVLVHGTVDGQSRAYICKPVFDGDSVLFDTYEEDGSASYMTFIRLYDGKATVDDIVDIPFGSKVKVTTRAANSLFEYLKTRIDVSMAESLVWPDVISEERCADGDDYGRDFMHRVSGGHVEAIRPQDVRVVGELWSEQLEMLRSDSMVKYYIAQTCTHLRPTKVGE